MYQWVKDKSDLTWNTKGELDGIPKSNILTLIDDVTRPTSRHKDIEPIGMSQFVSKLQESNLPEYLIGNSTHYKKYYTASGGETTKKRPHKLVSPHAVPVKTPHITTPEARGWGETANVTTPLKQWLTMDDM